MKDHTLPGRDQHGAKRRRIAVLGSCVTGNPLYQAAHAVELVYYQARTSFVSLNSPPLLLTGDALQWKSKFEERCVLADFQKTVLPDLQRSQPDAVIFDFIDERFDLLRSGPSYILFSDTLHASGFPGANSSQYERIARLSERALELWREAIVAFADIMLTLFPRTPLILHRCWWAAEYRDGPLVRAFNSGELFEIAVMNNLLAEYYGLFEAAVPDLRTVEIKNPLADAGHKFGLSPYHYDSEYDLELLRQIVNACLP